MQNGGKFPCATHLRRNLVRKLGSQWFRNMQKTKGFCHKHGNLPIWHRNDAKTSAKHHKRAIREGEGARAATPNGGEIPCEMQVDTIFNANLVRTCCENITKAAVKLHKRRDGYIAGGKWRGGNDAE